MNQRLRELYHRYILTHSKDPFNEGTDENADLIFTAYNPMCGDKFTFYISMEGDKIQDAHFKGYGCAISKASSSILTKKLIGRSRDEMMQMIADFMDIISAESGKDVTGISYDEELLAFEATREFPEREQCANLGWKELEKHL